MNNKTVYYQNNKQIVLNRSKEYYENNKKRLQEQAKNKYRELSNNKKKTKENMEEVDAKTCLKKINRDWKNINKKKLLQSKKISIKNFNLFFFTLYKNGTKNIDSW